MRWLALTLVLLNVACAAPIRMNHIQFVGSHNSYKKAMLAEHQKMLAAENPAVARTLAYEHVDLHTQLDLGLRKLEIDLFNEVATGRFVVGHVQVIDMQSHCPDLRTCLAEVRAWSNAHPRHVPIWISFNAKDQAIDGLEVPQKFDAAAFRRLDQLLEEMMGDVLIRPKEIAGLKWPALEDVRGKFLLLLDEAGAKRELYLEGWRDRPMFTNSPAGHEAAAVLVVNDPQRDGARIRSLVEQGYLVRTRADADTLEARNNDSSRRDAAFASGAQAVSTDYYLDTNPFGTSYRVSPVLRCNPRTAPAGCSVTE